MMTDRDTVETAQWTNRELLLRIYYQTVETNGSVRQLQSVVYGDDKTGVVGLVPQAHENTLYRERAKVLVRIVIGLASAMMTALIAILVALIEHVT